VAGNFRWIGKSLDGESVTLKRFRGTFNCAEYATPAWLEQNREVVRTAAVLDLETTGLNARTDQIIEIGVRKFKFNRATGEMLEAGASYNEFHDPGVPISPELTRLTGITNEMVAGKKIDWAAVDHFISDCSIILAHNAAFDRPFTDARSSISSEIPWGCSFKQVAWDEKGFPSRKLEVLSIYHGFFSDAHRAIHDADATLHLLTFSDPTTCKPYLGELLNNARKPMSRVFALGSPFETKDLLRSRGYQWFTPGPGTTFPEKCWVRTLPKDHLAEEIAWLESAVYKGTFRGAVNDIPITDNFKSIG